MPTCPQEGGGGGTAQGSVGGHASGGLTASPPNQTPLRKVSQSLAMWGAVQGIQLPRTRSGRSLSRSLPIPHFLSLYFVSNTPLHSRLRGRVHTHCLQSCSGPCRRCPSGLPGENAADTEEGTQGSSLLPALSTASGEGVEVIVLIV